MDTIVFLKDRSCHHSDSLRLHYSLLPKVAQYTVRHSYWFQDLIWIRRQTFRAKLRVRLLPSKHKVSSRIEPRPSKLLSVWFGRLLSRNRLAILEPLLRKSFSSFEALVTKNFNINLKKIRDLMSLPLIVNRLISSWRSSIVFCWVGLLPLLKNLLASAARVFSTWTSWWIRFFDLFDLADVTPKNKQMVSLLETFFGYNLLWGVTISKIKNSTWINLNMILNWMIIYCFFSPFIRVLFVIVSRNHVNFRFLTDALRTKIVPSKLQITYLRQRRRTIHTIYIILNS